MPRSTDDLPRPKPPSKSFLENTQALLQKRYEEGKKWVDRKKPDWDDSRDMYSNIIKGREHSWEANLVIPKAYYIIQTITPQILSAIFGFADFLTMKHPQLPDSRLIRLGKWFTWFLLRKMGLYMRMVELFIDSPIVGTSMLKLFMRNGLPAVDFLKVDDFIPDPRSRKPGDVDSMGFCFNKFTREFGELERATTQRLRNVPVSIPIGTDEFGGPVYQYIEMPQMMTEGLYFGLDEVWKTYVHKQSEDTETPDEEVTVDIPNLELVEYWGEIETTFGVYDVNRKSYSPGRYEEYVVTAVLDGDSVGTIIRCEPSQFRYRDLIEGRDKYLKPYVSSIYSAIPGTFYGRGAIDPVKSLITEMKEHHDLYLDEHKRSVMTILSVLERSGLTPRDTPFTPYAHWVMRSHDDIKRVDFPEINLQAFMQVHGLIDREIDRTSGSSTMMQGVPTTKRQTLGEVQSLMMEASRRFTVFVQMADHLTLRPLAFKTLLLMKSMPAILNGQAFNMPEEAIQVSATDLLDDIEFAFAATGMEPEYSKYTKQELFPKILRELAGLSQSTGGQYIINLPEVMTELSEIYNFKNVDRFVQPTQPMVPLGAIQAATEGDPGMQAAAQEILQRIQLMAEMQETTGKKGVKG